MNERPLIHYRNFLSDSARWNGFRFRPGDIVISTPPKAGTTWTQRICSLLIFQTPELPAPLGRVSPWLDMQTRSIDSVLADVERQEHRRFVKSHTPLDGLPFDPDVTYICVGRDPRDLALSMGNHMKNINPAALFAARDAAVGLDDLAELLPDGPPVLAETDEEQFWNWVERDEDPKAGLSGLAGAFRHWATFWAERDRANVVLLHYEDLQADLEGEMRRLADRLAIDVPADRWPELVAAATFESMRAQADEVVPDTSEQLWVNNRDFLRRGESGQWRGLLDADGLARYAARVEQCAAPDLSAWAHHGAPIT